MSLARTGQSGQPDVVARPVDPVVADALDLIERGKPHEGRRLLRDFLRGQPAEERCPFVVAAGVELLQGRPAIARKRLLAALERGL